MIYDISQTLRAGVAVWPGDQKFIQRWTMRLDRGDSVNVSSVTMSIHTGTHVDAPFHFDDRGADAARLPLDAFVGPARVVALRAGTSIDAAHISELDWSGMERVLFRTEASDIPDGIFPPDYPYFSEEAAGFLGRLGLRLVGIDSPSVDAFRSKTLVAHKALLRNNVAILEGLRLAAVPPGDYELIALPLKFSGLDGSPVRAVLRR